MSHFYCFIGQESSYITTAMALSRNRFELECNMYRLFIKMIAEQLFLNHVVFQVDHSNNSTFTGNDACPIGYYCPIGTDYPLPCPQGTFSRSTGVTTVDDCLPCLPGHYCNVLANVKNSTMPICDPG